MRQRTSCALAEVLRGRRSAFEASAKIAKTCCHSYSFFGRCGFLREV